MSLTNSPSWAYNPSTGFYSDVATQSLKIDDNSNAYASKTFASAGNQQNWTWSGWVKRSTLGQRNQHLFGAQQSGSNIGTIFFKSDDTLKVNNKTGNSNGDECRTNTKFRDTSAWYHIVVAFDGSQSTQSNRSKIYVNGVLQARTTELGLSTGNGYMNTNGKEHSIGARRENSTDHQFDGYLAEMHFIDGQTLSPTSFGETKNDIWIPKAYSGSYGTNGVYLKFAGNTNDSSGNSNNFTSFNISGHDYVADCPENNWCTLNSVEGTFDVTYSEGALKTASSGAYRTIVGTTFVSSGKWYFEHYNHGELGVVRVGNPNISVSTSTRGYNAAERFGAQGGEYAYNWYDGYKVNSNSFQSYGSTFADGDVTACALDLDAGTITFYKNNSSQGVAFSGLPAGKYAFAIGHSNSTEIANFGQDSTFAGNKTSGSANATDANGFGDFYYTPPSGHLAMCSANLPDPDGVDPNADESPKDYFNAITYTGTGSTNAKTGVGFKPDWLWIKQTNTSRSHRLLNSNMFSYYLASDNLNNQSPNDVVNSLDSDGFTLLSPSSVNQSGGSYVAWNWKVNGGTTVTNTNGSITTTVQANPDIGFSMLNYTGNGTNNATIGHGLSQAPEMIITKHRTGGNPGSNWIWFVYHRDVGTGGYLRLQATDGITGNNNSVKAVSASTYTLGTDGHINLSNGQFMVWVFHSVDGFSTFGSYRGNGNSDGTFIYTGFRPAYFVLKGLNGGRDWRVYDQLRNNPYNPQRNDLLLNENQADGTPPWGDSIDILSNGIKIRGGDSRTNGNNENYVYWAFAEQPFKYANAR